MKWPKNILIWWKVQIHWDTVVLHVNCYSYQPFPIFTPHQSQSIIFEEIFLKNFSKYFFKLNISDFSWRFNLKCPQRRVSWLNSYEHGKRSCAIRASQDEIPTFLPSGRCPIKLKRVRSKFPFWKDFHIAWTCNTHNNSIAWHKYGKNDSKTNADVYFYVGIFLFF